MRAARLEISKLCPQQTHQTVDGSSWCGWDTDRADSHCC